MRNHRWLHRFRLVPLTVASGLVISACGSTVRQATGPAETSLGEQSAHELDAATRNSPSDAAIAPETDGSGRAGPTLRDPNVSRNADLPAGTGAATVPRAKATPSSPGGRLPAGPGVKGVIDDTIRVGLVTGDASAGASALSAVSGGDYDSGGQNVDRQNAAAVDMINSMGGVAGRKVEPVYYFYNVAAYFQSSSRQQEAQRACAHWTEDNQVFAMMAAIAEDECAARSRSPFVVERLNPYPSRSRFESMAEYWYAPHEFMADRRERAMVRFLLAHRFFEKEAKVGIMIEDRPGIREGVERALKPALAAAGIKPEVEIVYPDPVESPWSNYVLQLQAAGVTHVVWSASTIGLPSFFMAQAAENQRFRPMWAVGSDQMPAAAMAALGAPREQLKNVRGMGWKPIYDVLDETPQSANGRTCAEWQEKYGEPAFNAIGWEVCEFLFFLKAAFARADVLSPAGLAAGVAKLGGDYGSVWTIGGTSQFGQRRHDGAAIGRYMVYDDRCRDDGANCFRYVGGPEPLG